MPVRKTSSFLNLLNNINSPVKINFERQRRRLVLVDIRYKLSRCFAWKHKFRPDSLTKLQKKVGKPMS